MRVTACGEGRCQLSRAGPGCSLEDSFRTTPGPGFRARRHSFPSCHWYSEGAAWLLCLQPSGSDTWLLLDSSQPSQRMSRAGLSQNRLGDRMLTYRNSAPQSFRPDHSWPSRLFGGVGTEVAVSPQAPGKLFYLGTPCNYPSRIPGQGKAD